MRKLLNDYSPQPVYNMKAVEQQTSISAATLRAWERRYMLVEPKRTASGYRLYSDRDVALLRWVRSQMNEGLTISRVVAMLETLRGHNEPIWLDGNESGTLAQQEAPIPVNHLVVQLFDALIDLDNQRADEVIEQAFAMYTMPTVYIDVIAPTLVEIGEAWHRGDMFITIEHFATTYLRGRLLGLLHAFPHRADMPRVFVGCAPTERHDVGALIFSVLLQQQGYNVIYLGQDVPVEDILDTALREHPALICLSANCSHTALLLKDVQSRLDLEKPPITQFGYGGRAFDADPALRQAIGGHYLGADLREAVNYVNNLLRTLRLAESYN